MKTRGVRLYGKNDLRIETFNLPEISDDEILAHVVTDSICMSTYKAVVQGSEHKRVPSDIDKRPIIIGHEFCGEIIKVGRNYKNRWSVGDRFVIQPAINYNGTMDAPGYSFAYIGGASEYVIIPKEVLETDNLIKYSSDCFYKGSLSEPMSCIIGAFNASYHTKIGTYEHIMGTKPNGNMIILGGCGPMGMGAIDYALNAYENKPKILVVTDMDIERVEECDKIFKNATNSLTVLATSSKEELLRYTSGEGYDDVFVFAPSKELIRLGSELLAEDGCLNFFAGPEIKDFFAEFNFYDAHYSGTHIVGTSGGNKDDMEKAVSLIESNSINPSCMITHIGGIDSIIDTTLKLPELRGGKKLIYLDIDLPLIEIKDLEELSKNGGEMAELYSKLYELCALHGGFWNEAAEKYLLSYMKRREKK